MRLLGILTLTALLTSSLHAHESDRELQMKAANDELTKRVAELLDENTKLKAHMANVLKQIREAPPGKTNIVIVGCNPQAIYENLMIQYVRTMYWNGSRRSFIEPWLQKNGKKCTEEDFKYIETTFLPEMYDTNRSKELIRFFRKTR